MITIAMIQYPTFNSGARPGRAAYLRSPTFDPRYVVSDVRGVLP